MYRSLSLGVILTTFFACITNYVLANTNADTLNIRKLIERSKRIAKIDLDSAAIYAVKAYRLSNEVEELGLAKEAANDLAHIYLLKNELDSSLIYVDKLISIDEVSHNYKDLVRHRLNKNTILLSKYEYEEAMNEVNVAQKIVEKHDIRDPKIRISLLGNLVGMYEIMAFETSGEEREKYYKEAVSAFVREKHLIEESGDVYADIPYHMSMIYHRMNMPDSAIFFAEDMYRLGEEENNNIFKLRALELLCEYALERNDLNSVGKYLELGKTLKKEDDRLKNDTRIDYYYVNYLYKKGEYKRALEYGLRIIPKVEKLEEKEKGTRQEELFSINEILYKTNRAVGNYSKALEHAQKCLELGEKINDKNVRIKLLRASIKKEYEHQEIENQLQAQTIKAQKRRLNQITGLMIALLVALGSLTINVFQRSNNQRRLKDNVYFLSRTQTELKSRINVLLKKNEELSQSANTTQSSEIQKPDLSENLLDEIEIGLTKLLAKNYHLHPECSLHSTAKRLNTNTSYLSKFFRQTRNTTFRKFINAQRINSAIERLSTDESFRSFTIEYIASEVGYKSRKTFTDLFKKATGMYPSKYIDALN